VIDGDANDLRFLDPSPCIVGLRAKGKGARSDRTGFVLDAAPPPHPEESAQASNIAVRDHLVVLLKATAGGRSV
jgi:hypothetical protein